MDNPKSSRKLLSNPVNQQNHTMANTGFIQKKLQQFYKDCSKTTLDFQGPPTRNKISQIAQK